MGPLDGVRVLELASIGPVPFCGMLFADMGADVVRIDRLIEQPKGSAYTLATDFMYRGVRSVAVDLKHPDGVSAVLSLVEHAAVVLEGFRPGVTERLGIGPEPCLARNGRLVYGRMTGWGQDGPYAQMAGHDLNYISLIGTLRALGPGGAPPTPPLNLIADYGGGGMLLAFGVLAALLEAERSGTGQVIDAAMIDGAALLSTNLYVSQAIGDWSDERGTNVLDGGAHFYQVYETSDSEYVSIAAMEPKFYAQLVAGLGFDASGLPAQWDRSTWPWMKERFAAVIRSRTRAEWCDAFEGTDVCFAPVLSAAEARDHPHVRARATFVSHGSVMQPHPAPRLSRTPGRIGGLPPRLGQHTEEVLTEWGLPSACVRDLLAGGIARQTLDADDGRATQAPS